MEDKKMKNIIDKLEGYTPSDEEISIIENLADKYMDKSEEDIFVEVIKVKSDMEDKISDEQYASILEKLDTIRPMLNEEQNIKLNKVIELLNKDK
ncbi:hypothetical protein [Tissierella praeacuta]|uniref:hypothetical protein n=1 Tax=Tissierella praeacuta TaxID=43131 RepID=UPI0028B1BCE4|nr:hypothetical protein [Tissierella praeacuta]